MTDITQKGVQIIDDNARTVSTGGMVLTNTITFTGDNTTSYVPLFNLTGTVQVLGLWGVVTEALQVHTAAYFLLEDQNAQTDITDAAGTDLSTVTAGSIIVKKGLAGAAVTLLNNAAGIVSEPTTLETLYFSPFVLTKRDGAVTQLQYSYATTDTPTTGAIQFFVNWIPISQDGKLEAA